jgi:integrase
MKQLKGVSYDEVDDGILKFEVIVPGTDGKQRRRKKVKAKMILHACTKACRKNCAQGGTLEIDEQDVEARYSAFRDLVLFGKPEPVTEPETAEATLAEWVQSNWKILTAPPMKPETARRRKSMLGVHIIPALGSLPLSQISSLHILDFQTAMAGKRYGDQKKPYSNATIIETLKVLQSILSKAKRRGALKFVPDFPSKEEGTKLIAPLPMLEMNADEERAFLRAFDDRDAFIARYTCSKRHKRDGSRPVEPHFHQFAGASLDIAYASFRASRPIFSLALATGLRRGDLLSLKWSSVDINQKLLRLTTSKTTTPVTVPLSRLAIEALQECRSRKLASSTWVFVQADGSQFSLSTLKRHFVTAKELAGITRRFRFHDCRHTFASKCASGNISLQKISKMLGHSTERMSARYSRPDAVDHAQLEAAVDRF